MACEDEDAVRLRKLDALLASEEPPEGLHVAIRDRHYPIHSGSRPCAAAAWRWFREHLGGDRLERHEAAAREGLSGGAQPPSRTALDVAKRLRELADVFEAEDMEVTWRDGDDRVSLRPQDASRIYRRLALRIEDGTLWPRKG